LRQDQISAIKLSDGLPSLVPAKKIYIAWKDDERGTCGVFNMRCGVGRDLRQKAARIAARGTASHL
jgi:hypothetical protein